MWDLETIKHMNTPEEIEKSRNRARAMNKIAYSAVENSVATVRPFVYTNHDKILASSHASDLEFAEREVAHGRGKIKFVSDSALRKPTHGGRVK
jgi:hypothetical protein